MEFLTRWCCSSNRPLSDLTPEEVGCLLDHLRLGRYRDAFAEALVDGAALAELDDPADVTQIGVSVNLHAKKLVRQVKQYREQGVPRSALQPQ